MLLQNRYQLKRQYARVAMEKVSQSSPRFDWAVVAFAGDGNDGGDGFASPKSSPPFFFSLMFM
jgi:NAD(P)H-hydrate repair Nnr-like enzyme with NAD(P)H-hydrate epimerase domain